MPDIVAYMTDADENRFVQFVLNAGAWLVPDIDYAEPQPVKIETLDGYWSFRSRLTRKYYVQRQDYTKSAPIFRTIEKDGSLIHYIGQCEGGWNIDFAGGGIFERGGGRYIRPGSFGHYPSHYVRDGLQAPPEELRAFYSVLKNYLLRGARRLLSTESKPWVLASAIAAMQGGARLVGFEHHTAANLAATKNTRGPRGKGKAREP